MKVYGPCGRLFLGVLLLFGLRAPAEPAESHPESHLESHPESHPVTNIYQLRTAEQLQSPHVITYRLAEWTQRRGRWIVPDVAYKDTGYFQDQTWFVGAGAQVLHHPHIDWTQELYFTQEAGPESHNKRSLWIWPVIDARLPKRWSGQAVPFPTIPLDRAQRCGFDIDRARLEWGATPHWRIGAGYSGGISKERTWQSKPFASVKRRSQLGDFDCWLQRLPDGAQVQMRWMLVRDEH